MIGSFLAFLIYILSKLIIDNFTTISNNSINNKLTDKFWFTENNKSLFFSNKFEGVYFSEGKTSNFIYKIKDNIFISMDDITKDTIIHGQISLRDDTLFIKEKYNEFIFITSD